MKQLIKEKLAKTNFGYKVYLKRQFKIHHGYTLNISTPSTISEKIAWIKLYGQLERCSKYVDKYEVRDYVKKTIGEEYLIPLIGVYDSADNINFNSLPTSFVIKATHASGWNEIVKDKRHINWSNLMKIVQEWTESSYYELKLERNYKPLKGRVVIEKFIEDPSGDLKDYKVFCFHGEPKLIQVDGERVTNHKRNIYDLNWNRIDIEVGFPQFSEEIKRPDMLENLLKIARMLSGNFPFVRVDLYCTNGKVYFGELTFTPDNGLAKHSNYDYDREIGELLDLKKYQNYLMN